MRGLRILRDNLAGAWAVMLGRAEGLTRLDFSVEGFWRSFAAILLVVPFSVLALLSQAKLAVETNATAPVDDGLGVELVTLVIDWVAFPLIFAALARPFGLGTRYVPFIVARNWAAVIMVAIVAIVHALHLVGLVPSSVTTLLLFAALALTLRFAYVLARTTLMVGPAVALPVVVLDFLVSLTIWTAAGRFA